MNRHDHRARLAGWLFLAPVGMNPALLLLSAGRLSCASGDGTALAGSGWHYSFLRQRDEPILGPGIDVGSAVPAPLANRLSDPNRRISCSSRQAMQPRDATEPSTICVPASRGDEPWLVVALKDTFVLRQWG